MERARERVVLEGLVAGLLAYGVVAVVFAVADIVLGRGLFHTPAVIGNLLFYGGLDPTASVTAGPVAAANGVHIALSMLVGLAAALLVHETELHPQLFYISFLVVVFFLLASTAILLGIPSAITRAAPWAVTLVANLAGALVAGAYLWRAHPALRGALEDTGAEKEEAEPATPPAK